MNDHLKPEAEFYEVLRRIVKEQHFIRANYWAQEANSTETGLRNLLFTLAVFLFTFTSPIFLDPKKLSIEPKFIFFISWLFLIASIIAGLFHTKIVIDFFSKSAKNSNFREKIFSEQIPWEKSDYDEAVKRSLELNRELTDPSVISLVFQLALLFIGFIYILSGASLILFKIL